MQLDQETATFITACVACGVIAGHFTLDLFDATASLIVRGIRYVQRQRRH